MITSDRPPGPEAGAGRDPSRRRLRATGRVLLLVAGFGFAALAGCAVLVGAAALTAQPLAFLSAGLAGFVVASYAVVRLVTRRWPAPRRARRRALLVGATLGIVLFGFTVLVPPGDPALPAVAVPGQRFVELSTGSRIAYVHLRAETRRQPEPVVFLHGGPGVPDLAGDSRYFGQLTADGFDVYLYDQVGSGASERLDDPTGYTLDRHVADLEAFRRHLGAEKLTLIGHSFGAGLAAAYIADHPDRVTRAVYSSPGDLDPAAGGASMVGRLDTARKFRLYARLMRPRDLLAFTLVQVNPKAAHALAGDEDMDARFDGHYNITRYALRCDGKPAPELHGLGAYANLYPQSASRRLDRDRRADFARARVPGLVIKGSCDYLSWSSVNDYLDAMPEPRLVYLRDAGHNAYQDRPDDYLATVRAFLTDQPLPVAPYAGRRMPADFEGPK